MQKKITEEGVERPVRAARIAELAHAIMHHKKAYYSGKPEIPDVAYDTLEDELKVLDPDHPVLQIVGAGAGSVSAMRKVEHATPMLSLDKTYEMTDLFRWAGTRPVMGTLKVDGNSLSVVYEKGRMVVAKTRGNGRVGEDVTEKAQWIADIPRGLPSGLSCEIRGELYCTEGNFLRLSDEMAQMGLDRPTSPRNIVAGLLGRKVHFELSRYFSFFAFDYISADGNTPRFKTEVEKFAWLGKAGFSLPHPQRLVSEKDIQGYLDYVRGLIAEDEIGLDGAVFSYDDLALHEELGVTAHHPRYKLSFKWQGQTAVSVIKEITWATSRLGIVTPVAVIEPVFLSGASITNITLHNAAHVKAFNLKKGDRIEIVRSGEVIPKFLGVVEGADGDYSWPRNCPDCGTGLISDDVRLKCPNATGCPAQQLGAILNWIRCAEIDDLNEKRLVPLMEAGLVSTMADLYKLGEEDFLVIPQTREKMAAKLFANIQASKSLPLASFLNGLGIEGAGRTTWEKLLEHFPGLEEMLAATPAEVAAIEGFAEKSAGQVVTGLAARRAWIRELLAAGVKPVAPESGTSGDGSLAGLQFVITGALSAPRTEVEKWIKQAGGKLASAVSKNTHAVVTEDPESGSSKMKKARELGVKIWNERQLRDAIAGK
jgi:DNA ligase (NAD+)